MPASNLAQCPPGDAGAHVTHLERSALLAAFEAPGHSLPRIGNGFVAMPARRAQSGAATGHSVTKRIALRLQRLDLVQFDDEFCPSRLTLTPAGCALAQQLLAPANEPPR